MPYYKSLRKFDNKDYSLRASEKLLSLRKGRLKEGIPNRSLDKTLLLATWNLRDFDSDKYKHGPREAESFHYIAEIISFFDIVALQEINEDLKPLKRIKDILGSNWDFITTDVNKTSGGNQERLAFIYDKRKVSFRNIAGEIIIPKGQLAPGIEETFDLPKGHKLIIEKDTIITTKHGNSISLNKGDEIEFQKTEHKVRLPDGQKLLRRQLVRTPFMVAFQSGWFKFNLCTVHILFGSESGKKKKRRVNEIKSISKFLSKKAREYKEIYKTSEHYIILGDLNIVSKEDETFKALKKNKFIVPNDTLLNTNRKKNRAYDQIAFAEENGKMRYTGKSGIFDFYKYVFKDNERITYEKYMKGKSDNSIKLSKMTSAEKDDYFKNNWRTFQMSDHFPLWVELEIDFSDEYLEQTIQNIQLGDFYNYE